MKSFKTTVVLFVCFFCNSQTVKPLFLKGESLQGVYYKDIDNNYDNFTGTWTYVNGDTMFTIVLVKKEKIFIQQYGYFTDFLVGEYQYIENGIEKVNTLSNLSTNTNPYNHQIAGSAIIKVQRHRCVTTVLIMKEGFSFIFQILHVQV